MSMNDIFVGDNGIISNCEKKFTSVYFVMLNNKTYT